MRFRKAIRAPHPAQPSTHPERESGDDRETLLRRPPETAEIQRRDCAQRENQRQRQRVSLFYFCVIVSRDDSSLAPFWRYSMYLILAGFFVCRQKNPSLEFSSFFYTSLLSNLTIFHHNIYNRRLACLFSPTFHGSWKTSQGRSSLPGSCTQIFKWPKSLIDPFILIDSI